MTIVGDRLAQVQLDAHRAVDRAYMPLAHAVEEAVLNRATPDARGIRRLSLPARAAILTDLTRLLDEARPRLLQTILEAMMAAEAAAQVDVAPLPRDLTAFLVAAGEISRSLRANQPNVISQSGALLVRGIAGGQPASTVARVVQQYFSPFFAPRRGVEGEVLRDRLGAVHSWPGRAGMASQHARGLMLWHTTAAHGRTMVRRAARDGQLLRYHVSHKHLEIDICSRLEHEDVGYGAGIYPADQFPGVPQHFRCRCWAEPASRPRFLTRSESVPA